MATAGTEQRNDELRVARAVSRGTLLFSLAATPVALVVLPAYRWRWLLVLCVITVTSIVLVRLTRAGRARLGGILYVATLFAMLVGLNLRGGGTMVPAFWGFVVVSLMAGLLIGKRAAVIVGITSCVAALIVAILESTGLLGGPVVTHNPYSRWLINVLYIGLVVTLHRLSISATRAALQRAESELAERGRVEQALRALATRFQLAAEAADIAVWDLDLRLQTIVGDSRFAELYGVGKRDEAKMSYEEWLAAVHGDDRSRVAATRDAGKSEFKIVRPDGDIRHVQASAAIIRADNGDPLRMVGVDIDVTGERLAEAERASLVHNLGERVKELTLLHQTARLLQSERPPDAVLLTELVNLIPRGWQYSEICEARIVVGTMDVRTSGWRDTPWQQSAPVDAGTNSGSLQVAYTELRKTEFEGPFSAEERRLIDSLADMLASWLEHHQSASALRRREAEFSGMFQGAAIGIALVGPDGIPITVNPAFSRFLGYTAEELTRMKFSEFTDPEDTSDDMAMYLEMISGAREYYQLEKRYLRKDGKPVWGRLTVSAVRGQDGGNSYFVGMVEDINAKKEAEAAKVRLEAQLLQSQKMEAMGLLAGGVAHDFNNLITIISGYSDLLLARRQATPDSKDMIQEIRDAGARAASLTRQLLTFSRRAVFEPAVIDPNTLIRDMERMLARLIGEDVQLSTSLPEDGGHVKVDRNQLEQALINLVVNARDAMPTGGRLRIATSTLELDAKYVEEQPDARTGRHVVIAVSDSGLGMSEETRSRIFEPFFTTKQRDRGTGLGLAMVYGFVKQCDGHVTVTTALGRGSTFRLVLPHVDDRLSSDRFTPQYVPLITGRERILLVEDDNAVRALTRHILLECGYDVVAIGRPTEAAALPDAELQRIGMLLTDVVMPELSGRQLADELRERMPALRVLYMSGYTDDAIMRHGVLESNVHFLQKPFTPQSLSLKVREVLDEEPGD